VPWPVYSERFLARQFVAAGAATYTIPAGTRLVLTTVAMVNQGPGLGTVDCRVGGFKVFRRVDLAVDSNTTFTTRTVGYAGEQLYLYSSGDGFAVSCHGYLLAAPGGAQGAQGDVVAPLPYVPAEPEDGALS